MGQKVNPYGFRLGITTDWKSRWFKERGYKELVIEDWKIRDYLTKQLESAAVSRIEIERNSDRVRVDIHTARPGIVIGRKGSEIEVMTKKVSDLAGGKQAKIDIVEIKQPETDAQLVAESVAGQLERRIGFRRAMKKAMQIAMDLGADGIKIRASGRLGGAEIARTEVVRAGTIPLHTLRTTIDYGFAEADTVAGKIGVKCWICKKPEKVAEPRETRAAEPAAEALA